MLEELRKTGRLRSHKKRLNEKLVFSENKVGQEKNVDGNIRVYE